MRDRTRLQPSFAKLIVALGRAVRLWLAAWLLLASLFASSSMASAEDCVKALKACGCSITSTGIYTLQQDLVFSSAGDCISIGAKNVVLNLDGFSITGPGETSTGAGVHVRNSKNVWVEGQSKASQRSTISGWKYGIENDGNEVLIENVSATANTKAGFYFYKASDGELISFEASHNSGFGVWLSSGSNDRVGNGMTSANGLDGVFLGCVGNGAGACASTGGDATSNTLFNLTSTSNGGGGITVQFNSNFDQIGNCFASGNTGFDLIDRHPNGTCGHDLWFVNTGTANETCID